MSKRHIEPLVHGRVRLRLLEEADLAMTLAWRNQDHIRKWFFDSDVITPEQHRAWWERYRTRDDDFVFMIEETDTLRRPVGQVALYNIDWSAGRGEFGRLMIGDADAKGVGLARSATSRLVDEALGSWGLSEVYLEVFEANAAALRVYADCGFQETARRDGTIAMRRRLIEPRSEAS
ncbi:MAG: GNAT family N-acetyltransferase [Vicinamibacterales bacterium]|jgi:RimJ/RimL family protein N-acetyltransferase